MNSTESRRGAGRFAGVALITVLAAAWAISGGCGHGGGGGDSLYGEAMSGLSITKISDILARPGEYDGKAVALRGKIVQECPTGCWFNLEDQTGVIYVDIKPSGFAIPQYTGKEVTVEGTVTVRGQRVMILGKGVKIG